MGYAIEINEIKFTLYARTCILPTSQHCALVGPFAIFPFSEEKVNVGVCWKHFVYLLPHQNMYNDVMKVLEMWNRQREYFWDLDIFIESAYWMQKVFSSFGFQFYVSYIHRRLNDSIGNCVFLKKMLVSLAWCSFSWNWLTARTNIRQYVLRYGNGYSLIKTLLYNFFWEVWKVFQKKPIHHLNKLNSSYIHIATYP